MNDRRMNTWGIVLFFTVMLTPMIIYFFKYTFSRIKTCGSTPFPSAQIVNIRTENDNWGKHRHIKTIVIFSDGTEYHTYKCKKEPGFGYIKVVVDTEVIKEIVDDALTAHQKLVDKTYGRR